MLIRSYPARRLPYPHVSPLLGNPSHTLSRKPGAGAALTLCLTRPWRVCYLRARPDARTLIAAAACRLWLWTGSPRARRSSARARNADQHAIPALVTTKPLRRSMTRRAKCTPSPDYKPASPRTPPNGQRTHASQVASWLTNSRGVTVSTDCSPVTTIHGQVLAG